MKKAAQMGKEKLAQEVELKQIKEQTKNAMDTLVEPKASPWMAEAEDITRDILAPRIMQGPDLKSSTFSVYKGLLRKLTVCREGTSVGVLGGREMRVQDCVLGNSTEEIFMCPEFKKRWTELGFGIMGLAVLGAPVDFNIRSICSLLTSLKSSLETLMTIVVKQESNIPEVWEVTPSAPDDERFNPVDVATAMENRKAGVHIFCGHFSLLGVSSSDKAVSMAHNIILQSLASSESLSRDDKTAVDKDSDMKADAAIAHYQINVVPADGMCFWHSLIGALNKGEYDLIPRKPSGYAANSRHVAQEEALAKKLVSEVLDQADGSPEDQVCANELRESPVVDLVLVPWICAKLKIGIRAMVHSEAGT